MAKKDLTVEEKLRQLYDLQLIDNQLTQLEILKGELPIEVADLEDEIAGFDTRLKRLEGQLKDQERDVQHYQTTIVDSKALITRYKMQLENVKNNREFEALTKELEIQNLEIELSEKRIKDVNQAIEGKQKNVDELKIKLEAKRKELAGKKLELQKIIEETEKQEKKLKKEADKVRKNVEERLLKAYDKIRTSYRNGLAVVTVERNSCGGCFNNVPPQMQLELGMLKKIVACEYCGRIIVDRSIFYSDTEIPVTVEAE